MALENKDFLNIYKKLEYNFLYNKDLNSIHILLNLYDLDKDIRNIYPKYISINRLKEDITRLFKYRDDKEFISSSVANLLHEDINRLELYIYLEGYKEGYFNRYLANTLESITIKYLSIDKLYRREFLHHCNTNIYEVYNLQMEIYDLLERNKEKMDIYDLVENYYEKIIEPKLISINKHILREDNENTLDEYELEMLLDCSLSVIMKNIAQLYRESYWYGLNDRVLKRYR